MIEKVEAIFSEYGKLFVIGVIGHMFFEKLPQSFNNIEIRALLR